MILVIIVIAIFLLYKLIIAIHKFLFYESIQRKARQMTIEELRNLRDYSRELSFGKVGKRRSGSTLKVRQG